MDTPRPPSATWLAAPIYLDHQATTPLDPRVLQAMFPYLTTAFGNPHALANAHGRKAARVVEEALLSIGQLVDAPGAAMVLTSGATEANAIAVHGICAAPRPESRNTVLIGALEHASVIEAARTAAKTHGLKLQTIPATADGLYDLAALEKLAGRHVLLACTMAANNEIGTIQPLAEIGRCLRPHDIVWQVDAAQAPMGMELSVTGLRIDLLTLSAHKMHGPQGIGALYVRPSPPLNLFSPMAGGGQQRGIRGGTIPLALAVGMGAAARLILKEGAEDKARIAMLRHLLEDVVLAAHPTAFIAGHTAPRLPGCLSIIIKGLDAEGLLLDLADSLSLSTGAACASANRKPSPTLQALGLSAQHTSGALRIGLGRFTTEAQINKAARTLVAALPRHMSPR